MSCDRREYLKEYYARPEVKERIKKWEKEYNQKPDVIARKKEYLQRPDVKKRKKEYWKRPDVKEKKKEYDQRPEIKNQIRNKNAGLKIQVINKLGGKCECCGITEWWNLAIDHIKPVIGKRLDTKKQYRSIIEGNTDNFQILCFGCNSSKSRSDKCRLNHTIS